MKTLKAIHTNNGNFIGWLHREYKETVSIINFIGITCKPVVSRGWRKLNLKEYEEKMITDSYPKEVGLETREEQLELKKSEYELALKIGKQRFGSPCEHVEVKNGICCNCLRKVI